MRFLPSCKRSTPPWRLPIIYERTRVTRFSQWYLEEIHPRGSLSFNRDISKEIFIKEFQCFI